MEKQRDGRIVVLDGLRLLAALMVAFYHYAGRVDVVSDAWGASPAVLLPRIHQLAQYGWLGVELFFMISGFVICMSAWGRDTRVFVRSRFIRLFPAYWPSVLLTATLIALWPVVAQPLPLSDVLLNLTMLQWPLGVHGVEGVYWTLWIEVQFYLLFAVVVWRGLTLSRAMWFGYAWLVASTIATSGDEKLLTFILQPEFAPLFVAGTAFYLIHRFGSSLKLWGLVAASYLLAQHHVLARIAATEKANIRAPLSDTVGILIITAFFALMAAIALGWTARIRWRSLTTAGLLTYPFYLLHENIGWLLIYATREWAPPKLILVGVLATMLLAAWLLHRYLERPLAAQLRRHLTPPHHAKPPARDPRSGQAEECVTTAPVPSGSPAR